MKSSISPVDWSELIAGYVLGDLTPEETAAVEAYIASNPTAQQELQELQAAFSMVADTAPLSAISVDSSPATAAELESLARMRQKVVVPQPLVTPTKAQTGQSLKNRLLPWLGWGLASIATMCASAFCWQNYQLDRQLTLARQEIQQSGQQFDEKLQVAQQEIQSQQVLLRQSGNKLLAIEGMDGGGKSTGSLIMSPAMDTAVLALQKVPALPEGKVYRMWAVMGEDEMACADFVPDKSGQVFQKISVKEWQSAKTVVVTIESAKQSPIPEGDAVMMGGEKIDL
jgi:Anti-sigma-K factor rskA